ncbi:hypothetical protein ACU4GD_10190 [Cupriavidus basilensis]
MRLGPGSSRRADGGFDRHRHHRPPCHGGCARTQRRALYVHVLYRGTADQMLAVANGSPMAV